MRVNPSNYHRIGLLVQLLVLSTKLDYAKENII